MGMCLGEPALDRFPLPADEFTSGALEAYEEQQAILSEYEGLHGMDLCDALYDALPAIVELVRRRRLPCAGLAIHNVLMAYATRVVTGKGDDDAKAVEKAVNGERIVA